MSIPAATLRLIRAQQIGALGEEDINAPPVVFVAYPTHQSIAFHSVESSRGGRLFDLDAAAELLLAEAILLPEIE